jgi:hypothetical protein
MELEAILNELNLKFGWHFLNGTFDGPFNWTDKLTDRTFSLVPIILPD